MRIDLAIDDGRDGAGSGAVRLAVSAAAAILVLLALLAPLLWPGRLQAVPALAVLGLGGAGAAAWRLAARRHRTGAAGAAEAIPVAAIGDLVAWLNASGDVIRVGTSGGSGVDILPSELAGRGLVNRINVADRPVFLKAVSDAARGASEVVAVRVLSGSAESALPRDHLWMEVRLHRVSPHGAGDGTAIVAVLRDASAERRHADELDQSRREAEKANELKGRFLATVSHELRTPLNAIIGFSELLSADHPFVLTDERRREYAGIIRNSGGHLLEIVNTLLDMSKIESGNCRFEPEPFGMEELVEGCCDLMQLKADQAGVTLARPSAARPLPEINADRAACRQILINLVSNAIKFTPAGGVVSVLLDVVDGDLDLTVADTGIGIPAADLPRLGNPFFQSGELHARRHEGTGLGLSVVRGLVGLHGGRMSIESAQGAGTSVSVVLPLTGSLHNDGRAPASVQTSVRPRIHQWQRKIA